MAVMNVTCPSCRHVVEVEEGESAKCPNCRTIVRGPAAAEPSVPPPQPGPQAPGPDTPPTAPGATVAAVLTVTDRKACVTRPASVVAFVFGLLVFVPFVTQVIAILTGLFAILRARKPRERLTLAWIGLAVGVVMLPVWILLAVQLASAISVAPGFAWGRAARVPDNGAWDEAVALQAEMERIHAAAAAYQRDFQKWPATVDVLCGQSLPRSFVMSPELTYQSVPESQRFSYSWVLMVSKPVEHDVFGEPLAEPRQLVTRLSGKIELLPAETVKKLLARQSEEAN